MPTRATERAMFQRRARPRAAQKNARMFDEPCKRNRLARIARQFAQERNERAGFARCGRVLDYPESEYSVFYDKALATERSPRP